MKINDQHLSGASSAEVSRAQQAGADAPRDKGGAKGSGSVDAVELSSLSRELRVRESESAERAEHIDKLREHYEAGAYQPSSEEVSRRIVQDAINAGTDE